MEGSGGVSHLCRPPGFKRKETRGKLAIGITTNFINRHSRAEVEVAEISGVARIYNQKFFQNLYNKTGWWSQPQHGGAKGPWPLLVQLEPQARDVPCVVGGMSPQGPCRGHLVAEPSAGTSPGSAPWLSSAPSPSPGIDLENIVYYKDDTHYFVMTAKKQSLLHKGVILQVRRAGPAPQSPEQWVPGDGGLL